MSSSLQMAFLGNGANEALSARRSILLSSIFAAAGSMSWMLPQPASARLESVNRPDLLPKEKNLNVIQVEKFLTSGQSKRLEGLLANLEKDTGFRGESV
jgi:hypothetical protein